MKTQIFKPDPQLEKALKTFKPDFKPDFKSRLIKQIYEINPNNYNTVFTHTFQRISLIGIAALVALLVTIFATEGSLIGTNHIDIETASYMIISGF